MIFRYRKEGQFDEFSYVQWRDEDAIGYQETIYIKQPIDHSEQLPVAYCEDLDSFGMTVASQLLGLDSTDKEFLETPLYAHPPIKQSLLPEPVAVRYDFDGHGFLYMDAGSGSDWASRVKDCEFLYTHPQKELTRKDFLEIWESEVNQCNFIEEHDIANFARAIIKASRGEK